MNMFENQGQEVAQGTIELGQVVPKDNVIRMADRISVAGMYGDPKVESKMDVITFNDGYSDLAKIMVHLENLANTFGADTVKAAIFLNWKMVEKPGPEVA